MSKTLDAILGFLADVTKGPFDEKCSSCGKLVQVATLTEVPEGWEVIFDGILCPDCKPKDTFGEIFK